MKLSNHFKKIVSFVSIRHLKMLSCAVLMQAWGYQGYAQTGQTYNPVDYWQFEPTAYTANSSSASPNGGNLDVCSTCYTTSYAPASNTVWVTPPVSSSNKGQLNFPLGSVDSKVYAMSSPVSYNASNNPWMNSANPVREATLEFLMKPNGLQRGLLINTAFGQFIWTHAGFNAALRISNGSGTVGTAFNNVDRLSPQYYFPTHSSNTPTSNSNWHHVVITINTFVTSGGTSQKVATVCFWVDGQKIGEKDIMTSLASDGTFIPSQLTVANNQSIKIGESKFPNNGIESYYPSAYYFEGQLDELTLYNKVIPQNLIQKHYSALLTYNAANKTHGLKTTFVTPNDYFIDNSTTQPVAYEPASDFDPKDAVPNNIYEGGSIQKQVANIPLPRYRPGHTLLRNANMSIWNSDKYMTSQGKLYNSPQNVGILNLELAKKWNYYLSANAVFSASDLFNVYRTQANANPDLPIAYSFFSTMYDQNTNTKPCVEEYDPADQSSFLYNAAGTLLGSTPQYKANGNTQDFENLGDIVKQRMETYWNGQTINTTTCSPTGTANPFNRPFTLVVDDDEHANLVPAVGSGYPNPGASGSLGQDPTVVADYNAWVLGQPAGQEKQNWYYYEGQRRFLHHKEPYKDKFMNVGTTNGAIDANTKFAPYQWALDWDYRAIREYTSDFNGKYYVPNSNYTGDPGSFVRSAFKIPRLLVDQAIKSGDKYISQWYTFSSYKSEKYGWSWGLTDTHDEVVLQDKHSVRPATALGFAKYMAMLGTEFSYLYYGRPGCNGSVNQNCADNPNAILWQYTIPGYAQAITSRYEDIFRDGSVMEGDIDYPSNGFGSTLINKQFLNVDPGVNVDVDAHTKYTFDTHDNRVLVGARKSSNGNRYAIATSIYNYGNEVKKDASGNIIERNAPLEATTEFNLEPTIRLKVKTRRQGSVYIFDNSNTSSPVAYQLDKWHQSEHPYYWSKNFYFDAELYDNAKYTYTNVTPNVTVDAFQITGSLPAPSIANGVSTYDLTNANAYIRFLKKDATNTNWIHNPIAAEYNFEPRSTDDNEIMYYGIKLKAMKINPNLPGTIGFEVYLDGGTTPVATLTDINPGTFSWHCLNGLIAAQANQNHVLKIKPIGSYSNGVYACTSWLDAIELVSYNDVKFEYDNTGTCLSYNFEAGVENACAGVTYAWDFGDGNTATTASASHTYSTFGTYNVTCTISIAGSNSIIKTFTVQTEFPDFDFDVIPVAGSCNKYEFKPIFSCMTPNSFEWNFDNPNNGATPVVNNSQASGNMNLISSNLALNCSTTVPTYTDNCNSSNAYNINDIYHTFNNTLGATIQNEYYVALTVNHTLPVGDPARKTMVKVVSIATDPVTGNCVGQVSLRSTPFVQADKPDTKAQTFVVNAHNIVLGLAPNPTEDQSKLMLNLDKAQEINIELTDMQGKSIWKSSKNIESGYQEYPISVKDLPQGVYFVRVTSTQGTQTLKLVKN